MASLFDPALKLERAKIHLEAMVREIETFRKEETHRITTEDDLQSQEFVIKVEALKDIPFPIALIAGDFISCLRSSLDHLAWQLALLTSDNPSRDISFPVCEKGSLETQLRIVKCTYGIPDAAISIMKKFQPYHAGDAYKTTHLWRLNRLWNLDKHRYIPIHSFVTDWLFHAPPPVKGVNLDNCNEVRVPLAVKDQVKFNPRFSVDVQFGSDSERIVLTLKDFADIYNHVAVEIFPAFTSLIPH